MRGNERFVRLGVTVFCIIAAVLLFYDTLFGSHALQALWDQFFTAVSPILVGAFLAYLLTPMVNFFERLFFHVSVRRARRRGKLSAPVVRAVSILLVWLITLLAVSLILSILLPELYRSSMQLASNLETYYNTITDWIRMLFDRFPEVETWLTDRLNDALGFAQAHGCVVVLKGHRTICAFPDGKAYVIDAGNPGMAKGGTGDVLRRAAGAPPAPAGGGHGLLAPRQGRGHRGDAPRRVRHEGVGHHREPQPGGDGDHGVEQERSCGKEAFFPY